MLGAGAIMGGHVGMSRHFSDQRIKLTELYRCCKYFYDALNFFDSQAVKRSTTIIRNFKITIEVRRID